VGEVLGVQLDETVDVVEGEAPNVREDVGEAEIDELTEGVLLGVDVGVGVGVGVSVHVAVALGVKERVEVVEGLAPNERLGVALDERVDEVVRVEVGASVGVTEPVGEGVGVGVGVGVGGDVIELVREREGVFEGEAPIVSEAVGEADTVELAERVVEGVPTPENGGVSVNVEVGVE